MLFHICFSTVHLNFDIIRWTMTIIGHCDGQSSRMFTISPVYPEFVTSTVRWEREKGVVSLSMDSWTKVYHTFFSSKHHMLEGYFLRDIDAATEGGRC